MIQQGFNVHVTITVTVVHPMDMIAYAEGNIGSFFSYNGSPHTPMRHIVN